MDKWKIGLGIALLAVLASWGSREYSHTKSLKSEVTKRESAENKLTLAESRITTMQTEMSKAVEKSKRRTETRLPDGTTTITEEEYERSLEEAKASVREEYQAKLEQAQTAITNLSYMVNEMESKVAKSSPRWNAVVGWDVLNGAYFAGGGMNFGPVSVFVDNPVAPLLNPRLSGMLRF